MGGGSSLDTAEYSEETLVAIGMWTAETLGNEDKIRNKVMEVVEGSLVWGIEVLETRKRGDSFEGEV